MAPSLPQSPLRQVSEVRCKALASGHKHSVELAEISQAILWVEVRSPPALFALGVVPPPIELGLGGQGRHCVKGLVDQPDVSGINDRALSDGGVHEHHVGIDDRSAFEVLKDPLFNAQGALCADAFSKPAKR